MNRVYDSICHSFGKLLVDVAVMFDVFEKR
jgi:hypothetical protein